MRFLVVLTAALAFACAALAGTGRVVGVGEQKDGENSKAHVGDTLVVSLAATPSTGTWKILTVTRTILRLDSTGYVAAKHPPLAGGGRGIAILTFKVVHLGKAFLKLNYVSPSGAIVKHFKVEVDVVRPGV